MATKLGVYQQVARLVGQPRFAALTDTVPLRYILDDAYADAVDYVLRMTPWKFALKESGLTNTASAIAGYASADTEPADSLRLVSIFVAADRIRGELPIDCRQQGGKVHWNYDGVLRTTYISTDGRVEATWTPGFFETVCAYLAYVATQRITQLNGRTDELLTIFERRLATAAEREAVPEREWLVHQLDGSFLSSVRFLLGQSPWRFALKTATLSASGTPQPGYSYAFPKPDDWLQTFAIFASSAGDERPIDCRQQANSISANLSSITLRYVSDDTQHNPVEWPEMFLRAVGSHLGIDFGDMGTSQDEQGRPVRQMLWPQYMDAAAERYAVPIDPWLRHQLDGSFLSSVQYLLGQFPWRFALKTATLTASGTPQPGFTYAFPKPADWLATYSVFVTNAGHESPVDCREQASSFSANVSSITLRYVSNAQIHTPFEWPEMFLRAVGAHLGINFGDLGAGQEQQMLWPQYMQAAAERYAIANNPWLTYQLDGTFAAAIREHLWVQDWRFATKASVLTATDDDEDGIFVYNKPVDWAATVRIYDEDGEDLRFRERGSTIETDTSPITWVYLDVDEYFDSSKWPEYLDTLLLSWCALARARSDPSTPGAVTQARLNDYERAKRSAKRTDDMRERPKINRHNGSWVTGRQRWSPRSHEEGGA